VGPDLSPTTVHGYRRYVDRLLAVQAEPALACGVGLDPDTYVLSDDAAGRTPLHPNLLSDRFCCGPISRWSRTCPVLDTTEPGIMVRRDALGCRDERLRARLPGRLLRASRAARLCRI